MAGFLIENQDVDEKVPQKYYKPTDSMLNAAVSDNDFGDVDIPFYDIYSQEFFLYAYQLVILKERKSFKESGEGYTYVNMKRLATLSQKIRRFLYTGDPGYSITKDDPYTKEFDAKLASKSKLFQLSEHDD